MEQDNTSEDFDEEIPEIDLKEEEEVSHFGLNVDQSSVEQLINTQRDPKPPANSEGKIADYERFFMEVFLEVYEVERGFYQAKGNYTEILLKRGIEVNPQEMYSNLELLVGRATKLMIIKRLCPALGLVSEMDEILKKEMDLIYRERGKSDPHFEHSVGEAE